jgi:glycosyltransferase involved in cell wall biosynthesis
MKKIKVLIPTYNRTEALTVTITSLCFQTYKNFDVVISDQSEEDLLKDDPSFQTAVNLLRTRKHKVEIFRNLPARGMAQQRQFLLNHSNAIFSLFLDDDLILEPYVINNMRKVIEGEHCGFVGNAVIGLSYKREIRYHQHNIEFWEGPVKPEVVIPKSPEWDRHKVHNAANIYHIQKKFNLTEEAPRKYKVAWVGGCVMYDTEKLLDTGGFGFWKDLPARHCGEDVLAQLRVMKKYGGCGILPSGVYHQELLTTVSDRKVNAPEYLEI